MARGSDSDIGPPFGTGRTRGVAPNLEGLYWRLFNTPLPVALRAWDGSTAGPNQAPCAVLRHPRALRRLLWRPGELGLARAYVSGDLTVDGDLTEGLRRGRSIPESTSRRRHVNPSTWVHLARVALRSGAVGPPPQPPASEAKPSGRRHSRARDQSVINHHYDAGNRFYALLLDPLMTYSCGYWTSDAPGYTLTDAQQDKLDRVCRKLGLSPGMRLLDVGCGWGSLVLYAAEQYGVHATGVTLSRSQYDHVRRRIEQLGLHGRADIRMQDYRDVDDEPYDAVASLEMGEHVGARNYPRYATALHDLVRPGGSVLVQQMSRGAHAPGGGAFIASYIAPDMHMVPVGRTLDRLEEAGFEVRDVQAMREHYVRTVRAWARTLDDNLEEAAELIGWEQVRVWQLYLAGGALAFEEGRMGVDQIVGQRPVRHRSGPRTLRLAAAVGGRASTGAEVQ